MKIAPTVLGFVIAGAITIASGWMHGQWSRRWSPVGEAHPLAAHLEQLPGRIGDWEQCGSQALAKDVLATLECAGHVQRVYRNPRTGQEVTVALLLGPSGPMSAHRPDICYAGLGYGELGDRQFQSVVTDDVTDKFTVMTLQSRSVDAVTVRIWYGWTDGGPWKSPANPRWAFVGTPFLYKLQVVSAVSPDPSVAAPDACKDFVEALLPVLRGGVIPAATTSTSGPKAAQGSQQPRALRVCWLSLNDAGRIAFFGDRSPAPSSHLGVSP